MVSNSSPSTNGDDGHDGRDKKGRFTRGNKLGGGSPYAAQVAKWRKAMTQCITEEDMQAVTRKLVEQARAGEAWAIRELYDRTLGKPQEADFVERLEALEEQLAKREDAKW